MHSGPTPSKTASGHITEVHSMVRCALALGFDPFLGLGPFPMGTHLGMKEAIMVVMRSMERGNTKSPVQWGTARKAHSTLSLLWENSPESSTDVVLSAEGKIRRLVTTTTLAEGRWYQYFLARRVRMGDIIDQDRAYTTAVLHSLLAMYK